MDIRIVRITTSPLGTNGKLSIDGQFECFTLERPEVQIEPGTFKATVYISPTHNYKVLLLHDVPNRSMIEVHRGNWPKDSKGCILVGRRAGHGYLEESTLALDALIVKAEKADDIEVTVI